MKWIDVNKFDHSEEDNKGREITINSDNIIYFESFPEGRKVFTTIHFLDQSSVRVTQTKYEVRQLIDREGAK